MGRPSLYEAVGWHCVSDGAGVVIRDPEGRSGFLQGDDAARFLDRLDKCDERFTWADLCREYEAIMGIDR